MADARILHHVSSVVASLYGLCGNGAEDEDYSNSATRVLQFDETSTQNVNDQ